ncbi:POTRA domain-containing protein, partial [Aliarcobacter butzleri]
MNINKIISLSILSSSIVLGATLPNVNSGTIQKQLVTPNVQIEKKENVQIQGVQSDNIKTDLNNKKIFIKDFTFKNNITVSSDELKQSLKTFANKELSYSQIQEVLAVITKVYRDKGFFVARAYLEKQDLLKNNSILNITIIEGKYSEIKLNNNSLVNNDTLQNILDNVKSNDIINVEDIQRALLLINDRA